MSRIGRKPIAIPAGVDVTIADGNVVTVKGPKGTLPETFNGRMTITKEGNEIHVTRPTNEKEDRAIHGLTRTLIHNMVEGVTNGFSKKTVGQIAAQIREKRPPEPYLGKGIRYTGEHIRRKAGKTGK